MTMPPGVESEFWASWAHNSGDDFASRLARQSLSAMATKIDPTWHPPGSVLTAVLREANEENRLIDPWSVSRILGSLHDATARLYAAIVRGVSLQTRVSAEDRAAVRLAIAGATGGSLQVQIVGAPAVDPQTALLPPTRTPLDLALSDLLAALSNDQSDSAVAENVLASSPVIRRAVWDLVDNDAASHIDLYLTLDAADGSHSRASIPSGRATVLREALKQPEEDTSTETRTGVLDGFRTSRNVFYFIGDDGSEIDGIIGDQLAISQVRELTDTPVEARMTVVTIRPRGGGRATKSYRLDAIRPEGDT